MSQELLSSPSHLFLHFNWCFLNRKVDCKCILKLLIRNIPTWYSNDSVFILFKVPLLSKPLALTCLGAHKYKTPTMGQGKENKALPLFQVFPHYSIQLTEDVRTHPCRKFSCLHYILVIRETTGTRLTKTENDEVRNSSVVKLQNQCYLWRNKGCFSHLGNVFSQFPAELHEKTEERWFVLR